MNYSSLLERFIRYAKINTEANPDSESYPSSDCQWELLRLLYAELEKIGVSDLKIDDEYGYVTASIPSNSAKRDLPTIAFFAHVDTAPDYSGKGVEPIVYENYDGQPIHYPKNDELVLDPREFPKLGEKIGETIITTSGDTLLGGDDKAGVAVIMELAEKLCSSSEIIHGPLRICFNPDEEIGRGVLHLDLEELGADVAYTLDAGELGKYNFECFSADHVRIEIQGVSIHTGDAKGVMVNSLCLASALVDSLPVDSMRPENTEGHEGFIHPYVIRGDAARCEVQILLRDFEREGLRDKGRLIQDHCGKLRAANPRARISCEIKKQYRNMRYWLEDDMRPVDFARRAIEAVGVVPVAEPIRGGTDGSILTERGLPTPNLFNGPHCCHGPREWLSLQDMQKSFEMCLELIQLWERETVN